MHKLSWLQKAKIAWIVLFHRKTPFAAKAIIIGALLYAVLPIDLLPDVVPLLGIADDVTVLAMAILAFLRWTKTLRETLEQKKDIIEAEVV